MDSILKVEALEKNYKNNKVLFGVSFGVSKGEILCFLGPNGAGKTTIINILTGALGYDAGKISYHGKPLRKDRIRFKQNIGVVPQELALYEDLTAERNVRFFASLYGLKGRALTEHCAYALDFAGLSDRAHDKVKTFSGGMKRRLNIACALAHKPEILIMDEPTVGIDPQSRNHILNSIKALRDGGMTILYTTHYMEEVEEISTRIIVIDNGKIIAQGTKEELKESIADEIQYSIEVDGADNLSPELFDGIAGVKQVSFLENYIELTIQKGVENLDRIIAALICTPAKIQSISCRTASLETVFLTLTGKSLRD